MENHTEPQKLGGWLILVGIGVVLSAIQLFISTLATYFPIFADGIWAAVTTQSSEFYHPLWGPVLLGEILFNFGKVAVLLYMIYLFFSRDYLFPKFYIGVMVVTLIFIPFDAWLVKIILPNEPMFDPDTSLAFFTTLISSFIWIPYLLFSKRATGTFVKGKPESEIQPAPDPIDGN